MRLSLGVKKKKSHDNLSLCMSKGCHDIRIQSPPTSNFQNERPEPAEIGYYYRRVRVTLLV